MGLESAVNGALRPRDGWVQHLTGVGGQPARWGKEGLQVDHWEAVAGRAVLRHGSCH